MQYQKCADILGADVVAFLRRRQQRMQHLDQRLNILSGFRSTLVRSVQTTIAVGVGIVLSKGVEAAEYRPCRRATICLDCSRRQVRSWRSRFAAAATAGSLQLQEWRFCAELLFSLLQHQGLIDPTSNRRRPVPFLDDRSKRLGRKELLSGLSKIGLNWFSASKT